MKNKWEKAGLIYCPTLSRRWMAGGYAQVPIPVFLNDDLFRIYYSSRDIDNHSRIGFIEINIKEPHRILYETPDPILSLGEMGTFDYEGTVASSVIQSDGKWFLYYLGWNRGTGNLFYPAIGMAISYDNGITFEKYSNAPIMQRSKYDPWMASGPRVIKIKNKFIMYYISGIRWQNDSESVYNIKIAESDDGYEWTSSGQVALDVDERRTNISFLTPLKDEYEDKYEGWYSYVEGQGYRIGYAVSKDGYHWSCKDEEVGIHLSEDGWDSLEMEYPYVIRHKGRKYLFYNGNQTGKDGIGLAVEI